jgi:hypothetical protein
MGKSLKIILDEEVERTVNSLPKNQLVPILKTLLTEKDDIILRSLRGYVDDFNSSNQIPPENWNWLRDTLKVLANSNQRFQFKCKEVNNKLYCVKHYTKLPFEISEAVEDELKYELKKYFKEIVYEEVDQFIDAFFSLPFEFVSLAVRYVTNVLAAEKKNELTTTTEDAENFLKAVLKKKNDFITNVNKISLGQANNISIGNLSLLLDVKAFYDYNALNNGVLEFVLKMLNSNIKQKLKDTYGSSKMDFVKAQILSHASYLKFLKNVKEGVEQPFFDIKGFQNAERTPSFDDLVKKYFAPKEYIPSTPKIEEPAAPIEQETPEAPQESPPAPE